MLDIVKVREKEFRGHRFRFAEVRGTPADHASWWSFDDEQELRDRWWDPKPGETVLDIGAAFGSYALPALACGARVVCFSPAEFDTELLEHNLSLNPELARRCLVLRDGLYSAQGWFNPDRCEFRDKSWPCNEYGWLRVRSLLEVLQERPGIGRVAWMKLDVEGAELEVLKGAEWILHAERPKVLVENHNFHDKQMEQKVVEYMTRFGYKADGPHQHCAVSHTFFVPR